MKFPFLSGLPGLPGLFGLFSLFLFPLSYAEHPLAVADAALGRQAIQSFVEKGPEALPELQKLAQSDDPRVAYRAKEAVGGITGHWGSQVDLIWGRSFEEAQNRGKPIMLLHLFGNLDEEFC